MITMVRLEWGEEFFWKLLKLKGETSGRGNNLLCLTLSNLWDNNCRFCGIFIAPTDMNIRRRRQWKFLWIFWYYAEMWKTNVKVSQHTDCTASRVPELYFHNNSPSFLVLHHFFFCCFVCLLNDYEIMSMSTQVNEEERKILMFFFSISRETRDEIKMFCISPFRLEPPTRRSRKTCTRFSSGNEHRKMWKCRVLRIFCGGFEMSVCM